VQLSSAPRRIKLGVLAGVLFIVALGSAWLGILALTNMNVPAVLVMCENPSDLRCSDHFFLGRRGAQNTGGSVFVAFALLFSFAAGAAAVSAADRRGVRRLST
jgi:hypothetical protein